MRLRSMGIIPPLFAGTFLFASLAFSQITNVTNDQSTPIPGVGHDYIHVLTETVNPANGSVSLRIQVPVPKGRGFTIPFSFAYDSDGVHHIIGSSSEGAVLWADNSTFLSQGGWSYSVPLLSEVGEQRTWNPSGYPTSQYVCSYFTDYMFQAPTGGRHALYLAVAQPAGNNDCVSDMPNLPKSFLSGGDDFYQAVVSPWTGTGPTPVTVVDRDGTVYGFSNSAAHILPGSSAYSALPDFVEDRNGNKVTFSDSGNGSFTIMDTLGRSAIISSGFGQSGNTVAVAGLSTPYTLDWGTATSNYGVNPTPVGQQSSDCAPVQPVTTTQQVITAITLPNG